MTNQRLFERLDAMVRWTGIPAFAEGRPRRRPLRGPATFSLILALAGYIMLLGSPRHAVFGLIILIVGLSIGHFMRLLGPLKPFGAMERVDEWDQAARARSIAFTYMLVSATAPLSLILLAAVANWARWDMARLSEAMVATGFLLMTVFSAMPTAHASWTVRWVRDEDPID